MLKRKMRTSEGLQKVLSISSNEVITFKENTQSSNENSKRQSETWTSSQKEQSASGLVLKLKRSSAKLLSILGLWSSGNSENFATTSSSVVDIDSSYYGNDLDYGSESVIIKNDSIDSCKPFNDLPAKLDYQKLSMFGSPTIIRRTRTRPRLGFGHVEGSCPILSDKKSNDSMREGTDKYTDCSLIFSQSECCSSLDGVSTSFMPLSSGHENLQRFRSSSSKSAPSIHSITRFNIKPSIVTVEMTAVAKVFFETHFNSIYLTQNGRNQRFRELQEHLCALPLSEKERLAAQKAWIVQESDYLRQSRVLRSRSNRSHDPDTVSTAGYEIIRVLGQGSFGVVQLVKEKSISHDQLSGKGRRTDMALEGQKGSGYSRRFTRRPSQVSDNRVSKKGTLGRKQHNVYAMKVIRKAEMVRLCQEGHIRAEREFLSASERSKWIVPLIASFQDADHLYLVMEYEIGGDFFGLLIQHGVLSERDTMWYVAEMILCVEEAHRLGWIHRDVKPENFLISASGHLKLADFGLAFDGHWSHNQAYFHNHRYSLISKLGIDIQGDAEDQSDSLKTKQPDVALFQQNKDDANGHQLGEPMLDWRDRKEKRHFARSIVGTSQYMAPEIVNGEPYDGRCDYWSIGIILYECLYGVTPFYCEDRDDTKKCILVGSSTPFHYKKSNLLQNYRKHLCFHRERLSDLLISSYAISLIQQLIQRKEFRLSSRGYKANDCALWHSLHSPVYANATDLRNCHWNERHVFSDDASDIKAHQWFHDIPWSEMLHHRPPYIPPERIWEEISGPNKERLDFADQINVQEKDQLIDGGSMPKSDPLLFNYQKVAEVNVVKINVDDNNTARKRKHKEKRRARDKILRDAVVGTKALELRTKGAFVGYTWRRPKSVKDVLEIERGRSLLSDRF